MPKRKINHPISECILPRKIDLEGPWPVKKINGFSIAILNGKVVSLILAPKDLAVEKNSVSAYIKRSVIVELRLSKMKKITPLAIEIDNTKANEKFFC